MAIQTHAAGMEGLGTYLVDAASLASSTLGVAIGVALPDGCKHADIKVITGTLFIENDGTAATADAAMDFEEGEKYQIRNSRALIEDLRLFAAAAIRVKVALFS
jgi:hypothetical protein